MMKSLIFFRFLLTDVGRLEAEIFVFYYGVDFGGQNAEIFDFLLAYWKDFGELEADIFDLIWFWKDF